MATKKYLSLDRLTEYDTLIKAEINGKVANKADVEHTHDSYETKEDAQIKYDTITNAKADWSQNDESAIDYIKNRTHWKGTAPLVAIDFHSDIGLMYIDLGDTTEIQAYPNAQFRITFNDTVYEIATDVVPNSGNLYLGNPMIIPMAGLPDNGYPFGILIEIKTDSLNSWHIWSISEDFYNVKIEALGQTQPAYYQLDENYIPDTIARVSQLPTTPDWSQNDEFAKDYVKNRTHWKEIDGYEILLPEQTFSGTSGYELPNSFADVITPAKTWRITFNGVEYECTGVADGNLLTDCYMGNLALYNSSYTATPEYPFCIYSQYFSAYGLAINYIYFADNITSFTLKIEDMTKTIMKYHPLEEGYIPDTIARAVNGQYVVTTGGTGTAYTATVPSITSLTAGASFIMVPNVVSASTTPTLNVNGLGAKNIKRRLSNLPTSLQAGYSNTWLAKGKPFRVTYDGTTWIVEGHEKPSAADLYGLSATITELNYCGGVTSNIQTQIDSLKTTITTDDTGGDKSIIFTTSNVDSEFRYVSADGITSLTLDSIGTFTNTTEANYFIIFLSGTTATTITNILGVYFTGDDCEEGTFTPAASKTYEVGVWWNGLSWQAIARGI